jgi:D-alanyl-lipoteichoic acid acyltransferase DltB (MBOAT superfamily)
MNRLKKFITDFGLFFKGATDFKGRAYEMLESETKTEMDNFLLICFSDQLGMPLPISYYTLELLPYLVDEIEDWDKRMGKRKSVWEERWSNYDLDP